MKTKMILVLCIMSLVLFSFNTLEQEVKTVITSYEGFEYDTYTFVISGGDNEEDTYITFNEVSDDILKIFDLKSDKLVDQDFEIVYEITTSFNEVLETEDDEIVDEYEEDEPENIYILKSLKKVK